MTLSFPIFILYINLITMLRTSIKTCSHSFEQEDSQYGNIGGFIIDTTYLIVAEII